MTLKKIKLPHPAIIMICTWTTIYFCYFIAPFNQEPSISLQGLLFVLLHIFIFCIGSIGGSVNLSPKKTKNINAPTYGTYKKINTFLYIGITGLIINILDKLSRLPMLSLLEITKFRSDSADSLLNGAITASTNWLGFVSYLSYPACLVGIVATITVFELVQKKTHILFLIAMLLILVFSIINGTRSLILVAIIFMSLAIYIRKCKGLTAIPDSRLIKIIFKLTIVFLVMYSAVVWKMRSEISDKSSESFISTISRTWQVTLKENIEPLASEHPDITQNIVSTLFYFTQSISNVEKILDTPEIPIFMGAHQIDIISAVIRVLQDGNNSIQQGNQILLENNIYGFFTGSWGGLYLDCGFYGSYIASIFWGFFAGRSYRNTKKDFYVNFTQYIFWIYTIIIGFASAPFGFSNSAITFSWFLAFMLLNQRKKYEK